MSKKATYELVLRRRGEYWSARSRIRRSLILDQLERDTGYNRKTLIRLLKRAKLSCTLNI